MQINPSKYGQYKSDIFTKLDFKFKARKKILDIGCGDGTDANIFIRLFRLNTYGIDIYKNKNISKIPKLKFKIAGIHKIPYLCSSFDYVFIHDVLHHIDEKNQRYGLHIKALKEMKRVCKKKGYIIIIEGNRYNPIFYPHMVKMLGHEHFKQDYFKKIVMAVFPKAVFKHFEAHLYPQKFIFIWKLYERIMELFAPTTILAYNVAIIKND